MERRFIVTVQADPFYTSPESRDFMRRWDALNGVREYQGEPRPKSKSRPMAAVEWVVSFFFIEWIVGAILAGTELSLGAVLLIRFGIFAAFVIGALATIASRTRSTD